MKRYSWTSIAIGITMPVLLLLLWWLLYRLVPSQWCAASVGAAKISGTEASPHDCTAILLSLIDTYKAAIIGLLAVVGLAFLAFVARDLGVGIDVHGPAGLGAKLGTDETPAAKTITTTTTEVAAQGDQA